MHPMTSEDVFNFIKEAGLPRRLEASVTQLFEAIHQGHTAQRLSNEEAKSNKEPPTPLPALSGRVCRAAISRPNLLTNGQLFISSLNNFMDLLFTSCK